MAATLACCGMFSNQTRDFMIAHTQISRPPVVQMADSYMSSNVVSFYTLPFLHLMSFSTFYLTVRVVFDFANQLSAFFKKSNITCHPRGDYGRVIKKTRAGALDYLLQIT